jgi:predicted DNA binding CopG/RHH family protein
MKKVNMFKKIEKLYFNKSFSDVTTQDIADLF